MKNNNQKRIKVLVICITIITVIVIVGVGYAFFSASISNANHETVSTETGTLSLKFEDGDNGVRGNLNLGKSITKKFTLQNIGSLDIYAKINWYNLVNTYMNGSLTYNLEQSTSENGSYSSIESNNVPVSSTETTETLKNGILVPVNTTYYYRLTITFNNLENVNQNSDINAKFYSYFSLEEGSLSGTDKIKNLVAGANTSSVDVINAENVSDACTNTLAYDGTSDNNLRYVGANPCNYVTFNDEVAGWRIIGVMNNVENRIGKKETRIKLVRKTSLGRYSWDVSDSNINSGYGINDWSQADLMYELNGDYLNSNLNSNTNWYSSIYDGKYIASTLEYDYKLSLKDSAQNLLEDAKWYLGGLNKNDNLITSNVYKLERGDNVWGQTEEQVCNDGACPRATEWTGKVGLPYPSDYGFSVGDFQCKNTSLNSYSSMCKFSSWFYESISSFITPRASSPSLVYRIETSGYGTGNIIADEPIIYSYNINPSLYLKSSVQITGGNGSPENPYTLG